MSGHSKGSTTENDCYSKPLHAAINANDIEKLRELLATGQHDVNERDGKWYLGSFIPLMVAMDLIQYFNDLSSSSSKRDLLVDRHRDLIKTRFDMAKMLIEHNADLSLQDYIGRTVVMMAVENKRTDFLKLVLDHGGPVLTAPVLLFPPLHFAVSGGNIAIVRLLMSAGKTETSSDMKLADAWVNARNPRRLLREKFPDMNEVWWQWRTRYAQIADLVEEEIKRRCKCLL